MIKLSQCTIALLPPKATMKRFRLALIVLCISTLLVLPYGIHQFQKYAHYLQKPSVISECPDSIAQENSFREVAGSTTQKIHAVKVVVQPWQGRHHVFGVFVLPAGYEPGSYFEVSLKDEASYCGEITPAMNPLHVIPTQPGDRAFVGLLRTRTAMWLITKGKRQQLKQPRNWILHVEKPA